MSDLADVSVRLTANGMGSIVVNGEDISGAVVGIGIQSRVGQPLVLQLQQMIGSVEITGQGVVQIANPGNGRAAIQSFLDQVDPVTLSEEVLDEGSLDEPPFVTALKILKERASRDDIR